MEKYEVRSVRYNFIMNFILTATNIIFPLIAFPYISRVLQAAGNGKVTFAASVANYFMMVASLGIPTYGIRACARVRDNRQELSRTVQELFIINAVMTCLVTATYVVCVLMIPRFAEEKTLFLINGMNIILNLFGMNWVYQALEQYDYITFRSIAFKIISIALMFVLVHAQSDYVIYGAINVFAAVGSNVLNFIRLQKIVDFRFHGNYHLKRHMKPIMILFSQSLAISIYTNLDTVMLGFMKTDVDVGYYQAAVKIKDLLVGLVTSLGSVLLPRMSYFVKQGNMREFKSYMVKALNFELMMSIPLVLYFVMFAGESIAILAGAGYEGAVSAMRIITISVIPIGITGVLGIQVLTSLEKEKYVLISVIVGAITDFLLNLVFIPQSGAAGAALATMIAEFLVLAVQVGYTRNLLAEAKSGFRIPYYVILSAISGGLAFLVGRTGLSNLMALLLSVIVFFGTYGAGLLMMKEPVVVETLHGFRNRKQDE